MSSNSNLGYTGYLLGKTVQSHSLRKEHSNFNDFREKNMLLYINKKVGHTREKEGVHLSNQALQKGIHLLVRKGQSSKAKNNDDDDENATHTQNDEVDLIQLQKDEEKERDNPFYKEAMQKMKENEFSDDFAIVSEENKLGHQNHNKKQRSDIEQTLNVLVANNIEQQRIHELFRDYKKISLKDKLNELKSRHLDMAKIQRRIKKEQQKMQEFEDTEKVNKFMTQICNTRGLTIGKILSINEEEIQYNEEGPVVDGIQKAKALEMLEELMEDQEEDNQKTMIRIFKQSQLDNIDADAARNKFNMTSFKKKNEQTEKLYNQMAKKNKRAILNALKDPAADPSKFSRSKNTVKPPSEKINVFRRLTADTSDATGGSSKQKKLSTFQINPQNLQTTKDVYHKHLQSEFMKSRDPSLPSKANSTPQKPDIDPQFFMPRPIQLSRYSMSQNSLIPPQEQTPLVKSRRLVSAHLQQSGLSTKQTNYSMNSTDLKTVQYRMDSPRFESQFSRPHSSLKVKGNSQPSLFNSQQNFYQNSRYSQPEIHPIRSPSRSEAPTNSEITEEEKLKKRIIVLKDKKMNGKAKQLQRIVDRIETSKSVADFVSVCNSIKAEASFSSKATSSKIKQLEKIIEDQLNDVQEQQQGEIAIEAKVDNQNFIEFIKRADFKRKLIKFLISKVDKKSDLYSKYQSKQFTNNFFQKLNERDPVTPQVE